MIYMIIINTFVRGILPVVVSGFFTFYYLYSEQPTQACLTMFGLYLVMFIYVMCKWICHQLNLNGKVARFITVAGGCSFGVYLIHGFIYTLLDDYIFSMGISMSYGVAWIRAILVFVVGTIIVWIYKRMRAFIK